MHIYTYIHLNILQAERGENYSLAHQCKGLILLLDVAVHRIKLTCSRIYRNMSTQAKTRHKQWGKKLLGQLKLIGGTKYIFFHSILYYGMEMFILLVDVYPLKIATDRNFIRCDIFVWRLRVSWINQWLI